MVGRPLAPAAKLQQNAISSCGDMVVEPKRKLRQVNLTMLVWGCLTLIILGVVTVARLGTMPQLPVLPLAYLPGNPLPPDVSCYTVGNEPLPRCFVKLLGKDIYFDFEAKTRVIRITFVPALEYTIGELIVSWGTPSGINQTPHTTYIYWGTRSAHLYTDQLRPDSRVLFVLYELEPKQTSPWRGFVRRWS